MPSEPADHTREPQRIELRGDPTRGNPNGLTGNATATTSFPRPNRHHRRAPSLPSVSAFVRPCCRFVRASLLPLRPAASVSSVQLHQSEVSWLCTRRWHSTHSNTQQGEEQAEKEEGTKEKRGKSREGASSGSGTATHAPLCRAPPAQRAHPAFHWPPAFSEPVHSSQHTFDPCRTRLFPSPFLSLICSHVEKHLVS
jgi:hypothetical protein